MTFLNNFFLKKDDNHEKFLKSFCFVFLAKFSFRSGSARSFNTQYGHLSPESSADEAGEEDEVEEEARAHQDQQKDVLVREQQKDVLVQEQQKEEKVRGRPERRKTQRIDYNQIEEAEEERKRLEKELEELNRQQEEDEIRKHDEEEKKKVQDENDRQSVILEMIGGLKPPSGSRARSVPRGRRREKVAAEVSGKRELILDDSFLR